MSKLLAGMDVEKASVLYYMKTKMSFYSINCMCVKFLYFNVFNMLQLLVHMWCTYVKELF